MLAGIWPGMSVGLRRAVPLLAALCIASVNQVHMLPAMLQRTRRFGECRSMLMMCSHAWLQAPIEGADLFSFCNLSTWVQTGASGE